MVNCPSCNAKTSKVHDYRTQIVRDCEAFEAVRKETQKQLKPNVRKYFKRSRSLLIKRYEYLSPEDKLAVNNMLWYSPEISEAHSIKE